MALKNSGPFFFTERQEEQLKSTNGTLCQLNREVCRELRRIEWSTLTHKQYRQAGVFLKSVAARMICVLQFREEILRSARERGPDRFELRYLLICNDCTAPPRDSGENRGNSDQYLEPDPAHLLQLDNLVDSCLETSERVWSRVIRRKILPDVFRNGLKCLTGALLRQRRHLLDTAPNPPVPTIEVVEDDCETCSVCHKPIIDIDDRDESSSTKNHSDKPTMRGNHEK